MKDLAERGKLARWYTQNIDCLEERLGLACYPNSNTSSTESKSAQVVTLHGSLNRVHCTQCKKSGPLTPELYAAFQAGRQEACEACIEAAAVREAAGKRKIGRIGVLRPDIVLYNEPHPHGDCISELVSADMNRLPNVLLVMGTSLKIAGLKRMIKEFATAMRKRQPEDSLIVFVNKTPASRSEWQNVFDYELVGGCDEILTALKTLEKTGKTGKKATEKTAEIETVQIDVNSNTNNAKSAPITPVKKPIVKKGKKTTEYCPVAPTVEPNVASPLLKHSKSKLSDSVLSASITSPFVARLNDFFSSAKTASLTSTTIGKVKTATKEPENKAEKSPAAMENLGI